MVKIYNSNRGQDYVVIGKAQKQSKVVMVKNSAITNNGSLFSQTKLYFLDMACLFKETDPFYFVPKIRRVVGHRTLNESSLKSVLNTLNMAWYPIDFKIELDKIIENFEILKYKDEIYPPLNVPDIKKAVNY
jgi:hypothetical protein